MDNIKPSRGHPGYRSQQRPVRGAGSTRAAHTAKQRHAGQRYWLVRSIGKVASKGRQTVWRKFKKTSFAQWPFQKIWRRVFVLFTLVLFVVSTVGTILQPFIDNKPYHISEQARALLPRKNVVFGTLLKQDNKGEKFIYNEGATTSSSVAGDSNQPRFAASFSKLATKGIEVSDTINKVSVGIKPKFPLAHAKQEDNQILYKLAKYPGVVVYTARTASVKEDIILEEFSKESITFEFELNVGDSLEARLEKDGSIGIYGSALPINGDVSTGSDTDKQLLDKVRQNSDKTKLLFQIPAPVVLEGDKKQSKAESRFELEGKTLKVVTTKLDQAKYPISIDPSVYVETAAKLMRGNNETNTDFDVDDELIQKSQTTGARIDAWEDNLDMTQGTWDHGVAAAGGYIYRVGGRVDPTKPSIVGQQRTLAGSDTGTFTMSMPTTRPAGDLYIAMMCHDGSDGGAVSAPSGWTPIADVQGYIAYYKVGTDQGGGNEAASYNWSGYGNEEWAGVVIRVTGFDSADPVSGTPGTGSSSSSVTPVFPATTPDADTTLVVRAVGFDQDDPPDTTWVPSGHTKIDSESSSNGGNGSCGFAAASLDTSPASGVSTGTQALAAGPNDDYGGSSIAINPSTASTGTKSSVYWAQFNSSTLAIESPNPGTGACSGWCTSTAYNLPEQRRAHSVVAYNGYLYVIGGTDGTNRESTVFIAKLGANGEPQLWHPTDSNKNNWVYWYTDSGLNGGTARSYLGAVAYNNRLYVLGGQTNATPGGVTTVEYADFRPNGVLGSWSAGTSLPAGAGTHMQSVQVYNDTLYTMGGFEGATTSSANMRSAVYYVKINTSTGALNTWTATTSFTTARASFGGSFTTIWGAYVYLSGGCTAVNGSGYCTTIASDTQIGSINADGTISEWGSISNLTNQRMGYSIIGWQNGLYRLGGCTAQNTSSGVCTASLADVDYGTVNPAGEVSTVNISVASGTAPCSGGSPHSCDLPPAGDDAGEGGQMLSMTTILNGYIYVIGGCIAYTCGGSDSGTGDDSDITGNISYASIDSSGRLTAPASCGGTSYGAWCVDASNRVNTTVGVAAAGIATFNNTIYLVGGIDNTADGVTEIYYNTTNPTTGALSGAWSNTSFATAGITGELAYTYAYARANPGSAGSNPGNLYVMGGCGAVSASSAGCSSSYRSEVYKCNIATAGSINGCTTTGQLQIDSELGDETDQGLGLHSGTVNANYIYLIGGYSANVADRDTVYYAKFDNSNNIVSVTTSAAGGNNDDWILSGSTLSVGRRRGWAFGYNGHIYSVGGYDDSGTGIIPFIEWSKMDVSDGSIDAFVTSSVTINQRWGLSMVVSNSYAYVIGGCDVGASPGSCTSFERSVQTFQLYNNDSGAANNFTAQSDQTFSADTDRWGASAAVYNGYLYVAGGCISATDCTNATNSTQYAAISASDGTVGTWAAGGNLPLDRAWGSLEVAGGTLYYIGGQDDTATNEQSTVYYTSSISSGNPTWNGTAATNGLPAARTKFGSAVWNNRLYVVGGLDGSAAASAVVYVSPQLSSGGNITSAWSSTTSFNVARTGAAVTAYANNLYLFGGFDGTNYLSDVQFTQINSDGTVDSWSYSTSLPFVMRDSRAISVNGYIYLVGGRTASTTCNPKVLITPIVANTTIATGNNPTGIGEWYETNVRYSGDRYGAAVAYDQGKLYTMGGGCSSPLSSNRHYYSTVKSQPQVAKYSRMIDTDTNVFPNSWLLNGVDNSIGARWQTQYKSAIDASNVVLQQSFDDGTNGNPVTEGTSQYNNCYANSPATITYNNSQYVSPNLSMRIATTTSTGGSAGCIDDFTSTTARYDRFYIRFENPTTLDSTQNMTILSYTNEAHTDTIAGLRLMTTAGNDGKLQIRDQTGGAQQTTTALAANTWHRVEIAIFGDALYLRTFEGANVNGSIPDQTLTDTALTNSAYDDFDRVTIGMVSTGFASSGTWGMYFDEHVASSSNWVGPSFMNWGQNTTYGDTTLGDVATYNPLAATYSTGTITQSGTTVTAGTGTRFVAEQVGATLTYLDGSTATINSVNSTGSTATVSVSKTIGSGQTFLVSNDTTSFSRWHYFFITIDASKTFGYPEDVARGPTITDMSLFFTADPSKRMRHGKTFTGGELQPLDTPCRQSVDAQCPLP